MTPWQELFEAQHPKSLALHRRAERVFANGATHDLRVQYPFPIYVTHASGAHKWDVDGRRYIDYVCGHGALLLGHGHPAVVAAVTEQMVKGTHFGACHEGEVHWGELVQRLVPTAERVRFVSSGTEAVLMALRVARAFTGRPKVLKFEGHFHGWHDYGMVGLSLPFDQPASPGIPDGVIQSMALCAAGHLARAKEILDAGDIAAAIVEPTGAHFGQVPLSSDFLRELSQICSANGTLLIFDEVVTGFRHSPGGVQATTSITPDLTTLAKILAGGLPGGALAGRADVMALFEHRDDAHWNRYQRVYHPGTFNANPLSSAAGIAALEIVATGEPHRQADLLADQLRRGLNEVMLRRGIAGCAYGEASIFHIYLENGYGPQPDVWQLAWSERAALLGSPKAQALHGAMLTQGIDLMRAGGFVSAAHSEDDVEQTIAAFDKSLEMIAQEVL